MAEESLDILVVIFVREFSISGCFFVFTQFEKGGSTVRQSDIPNEELLLCLVIFVVGQFIRLVQSQTVKQNRLCIFSAAKSFIPACLILLAFLHNGINILLAHRPIDFFDFLFSIFRFDQWFIALLIGLRNFFCPVLVDFLEFDHIFSHVDGHIFSFFSFRLFLFKFTFCQRSSILSGSVAFSNDSFRYEFFVETTRYKLEFLFGGIANRLCPVLHVITHPFRFQKAIAVDLHFHIFYASVKNAIFLVLAPVNAIF
mmetsp:Transcript_13873/g.32328  ORF Transcript_13873/g.32328 Transcript_13873/m.32328 type:complete len:256 (+) Transcript_13873:213-980(+)